MQTKGAKMIGTCIICDSRDDLVPICVTCTNEKVTMVVETERNVPLTAVSRDLGTPHPDMIKNALNRLKTEFGYGIPDTQE